MSLGKSPALTPARLDADRPNAQKSTGPRTARVRAQVRMNSLRRPASPCKGQGGWRTAPPCLGGAVDRVAGVALTPEPATQPLLA